LAGALHLRLIKDSIASDFDFVVWKPKTKSDAAAPCVYFEPRVIKKLMEDGA
jgi:hypothetical protein